MVMIVWYEAPLTVYLLRFLTFPAWPIFQSPPLRCPRPFNGCMARVMVRWWRRPRRRPAPRTIRFRPIP